MPPERRDFADGRALAGALARRVADALSARIAETGAASLAVSGGTTPARFLAALAREPVAWNRCTVTLVDERWVGGTSSRLNAALVQGNLLVGPARQARFVGLHTGDPDPETGLAAAEARIAALPRPFAAVVLGMGTDGHTASWFPGGDRLAAALDPASPRLVETMRAPGAAEPRITLTLAAVLDSLALVLHIEGEAKRAALEAALAPGPVAEMPVRAVLRQDRLAVETYWCP